MVCWMRFSARSRGEVSIKEDPESAMSSRSALERGFFSSWSRECWCWVANEGGKTMLDFILEILIEKSIITRLSTRRTSLVVVALR